MSRDILPLSFAPRDTHEAQVQFALERGVPALIGVLASKRLPYPSRAFDIAHCSRCLIPWGSNGNAMFKFTSIITYIFNVSHILLWLEYTCLHICTYEIKLRLVQYYKVYSMLIVN